MPRPSPPSPPLRRDAQRNREILITAAQAAFARHGIETSLEQIARDAGVAIGTLYRHFPTRVDLLVAAFAPRLAEFNAIAAEAATMDDSWEGFCLYLETLCGMQAEDRGFNDFISMRFPASEQTEGMHDRVCELAYEILGRAQTDGVVRPDIELADIISLTWANSRILEATRVVAPLAWRRHLFLMLDAFRATRWHPLPEPPLSDERLYQAMARLSD